MDTFKTKEKLYLIMISDINKVDNRYYSKLPERVYVELSLDRLDIEDSYSVLNMYYHFMLSMDDNMELRIGSLIRYCKKIGLGNVLLSTKGYKYVPKEIEDLNLVKDELELFVLRKLDKRNREILCIGEVRSKASIIKKKIQSANYKYISYDTVMKEYRNLVDKIEGCIKCLEEIKNI